MQGTLSICSVPLNLSRDKEKPAAINRRNGRESERGIKDKSKGIALLFQIRLPFFLG